mmetsp:Transcript_22375/g.25781  ORF Transcript_22375/g.25781 Transcript_22375/m.25781 type:complete len:213 (+) Transcript_22375:60-698(+)
MKLTRTMSTRTNSDLQWELDMLRKSTSTAIQMTWAEVEMLQNQCASQRRRAEKIESAISKIKSEREANNAENNFEEDSVSFANNGKYCQSEMENTQTGEYMPPNRPISSNNCGSVISSLTNPSVFSRINGTANPQHGSTKTITLEDKREEFTKPGYTDGSERTTKKLPDKNKFVSGENKNMCSDEKKSEYCHSEQYNQKMSDNDNGNTIENF